MDRESFIFYRSFYEAIKCMPQDVQAEIYPAICEYAPLRHGSWYVHFD